ncbi:MAG: hypothetical protein PSV40_05435 [Polaromonas sp.]|nr:hypothetical protein [Polaromonas sp.]MDI1268532.1 hypothetical protein [Polaromonas sp.]
MVFLAVLDGASRAGLVSGFLEFQLDDFDIPILRVLEQKNHGTVMMDEMP